MGRNFTSLWSESMDQIVFDVAISSDGNTIVASAGPSFSVFDGRGRLLWTKETTGDCLSVSVSQDGQSIAVCSSEGGVWLYDRNGTRRQLIEDAANSISMAADGSCIAVALTSGNSVALLSTNGKRELWRCSTPGPTAVATNADGSRVAVGAENLVSFHGSRGEELHRFQLEGNIYALALDATGTYIAAVPYNPSVLDFFSADGALRWQKSLSYSSWQVAVSDGGEVVACADAESVRVFARDGNELMSSDFDENIYSVALTPEASYLVAGGASSVKCVQTPFRFSAHSTAGSNGMPVTAIPEIRTHYLDFPPAGLCRWFNDFDKYLEEERYAACDALLEEIDGGGYDLDATERAYVSSRRGALALSRGIAHELKKQTEEADRYYNVALDFHVGCGNREGEGQVRALLGTGGDQSLRELLARQFKEQLKVLGSGEASLTRRVEEAATPDLLKLLESAKDAGHAEPLLTALNAERRDHFSGAANAVAALGLLKPGAGIDDVLKFLEHPSWFVRWRACDLISRFAKESYPDHEVHIAVTLALQRETDPDVRFELLLLLGDGVGNAVTDDLIGLLKDPDPNVRHQTCLVLAESGSRNALPALREVQEGQSTSGEDIREAADRAIDQITSREPTTESAKVMLYKPAMQAASSEVVRSRFFLPTESDLHGAIFVKNSRPFLTVWLKQEVVGSSAFRLNFYSVFLEDYVDPSWELLEFDEQEESKNRFNFKLRRPPQGWLPGNNNLFIYFDGEYIDADSFEVVNSISVRQCLLSQTTNSAGVLINPGNVFLQNTPGLFCQILVDKATFGLPYEISLLDKYGYRLRGQRQLGQGEGQQRILFDFLAPSLAPGTYTVQIDAGGLGEHRSRFEIIPSIRISKVGVYRDLNESGNAYMSVSEYHPHQDIVCAADLTAPANAVVSAELRLNDQPVFSAPVECVTRSSGEQVATFVFHPPKSEWPVGNYAVIVAAADVSVRSVNFQVKAVPLLEQVGTFARDTRDLVWYEAKPVAKSAVVWGVKLPILTVVLYLISALLTWVGGEGLVNSSWIPWIGSIIGASSLVWVVLVGVIFGVFQGISERYFWGRLHRAPLIALLVVFNIIVGQQDAYLVFGLGYLWPNALGQLFNKALFAAPIVAWIMVLFAFRFLDGDYMSRKDSWAFWIESIVTFVGVLAFYVIGLLGSVPTGLVLAAILWPFGWASTGWTIGVYAGFVLGIIGTIYLIARQQSV